MVHPTLPTRMSAPSRPGPRPLSAHLGAALAVWTSSIAALPPWRSGLLPWRPELAAAAESLRNEASAARSDHLIAALDGEIRHHFDLFLSGIEAYRAHPYHRRLADPPVVWQEGTTRLLDYGALDAKTLDGPPVLVVPSLVNRSYILDLSEQRSLLRYLVGRGLRPLLVDWGQPGPVERRFDLSAYVCGRLEGAFDAALASARRPVAVMGYCMGGLLALALTVRRQADIAALALLATPWDFHAGAGHLPALKALAEVYGMRGEGEVPVDCLQLAFLAVDPLQSARKFMAFAGRDPASPEADHYVAVEDWANDGIGLAAPVARECLGGWYGDNVTARGEWRIGGHAVLPETVTVPSLALLPSRDHLVPYGSSVALADRLGVTNRVHPDTGHIGMVVGGRARDQTWIPLADWLVRTAS